MSDNFLQVRKGLSLKGQTSEPSNPTDGDIYYDNTLNLFRKYENGAWSTFGGAGQGGINYIVNHDFESGVGDVNVTGNITKSEETADPIRKTKSLNLTISSSATTADYVDFLMEDIDPIDQEGSKVLVISFEYFTDANFSTDDVQFVLRRNDATAADIPLLDSLQGKIEASSKKVRFTSRVQVDDDANSYSLRMNVLSAPGSDSTIVIDSVKVGPDELVPGPIIGPWKDFTPTGTWTTNTTYLGRWRRVGDSMEIQWYLSLSGAPNSANLNLNIPAGYSVDTTKLAGAIPGSVYFTDAGAQEYIGGMFHIGGGVFRITHNGAGNSGNVNEANPFTWGSTDNLSTIVTVPILGWEASASLSTTEASLLSISTSTTDVTPTGTLTSTPSAVIFGTVDNDDFGLYNTSTGVWGPAPRTGEVDVNAFVPMGYTSETGITATLKATNNTTGKEIYDQQFLPGASTGIFPRIAGTLKVKRGETITFNASLNAAAGRSYQADSSFTIAYRPNFTHFSVYGETALIESKGVASTGPAAATWGDLTSIELPLGEWDIDVYVNFTDNASDALSFVGFSTTPGNSSTGLTSGDSMVTLDIPASKQGSLAIGGKGIPVSSTTTYYLKCFLSAKSGTPSINYKISARKIK